MNCMQKPPFEDVGLPSLYSLLQRAESARNYLGERLSAARPSLRRLGRDPWLCVSTSRWSCLDRERCNCRGRPEDVKLSPCPVNPFFCELPLRPTSASSSSVLCEHYWRCYRGGFSLPAGHGWWFFSSGRTYIVVLHHRGKHIVPFLVSFYFHFCLCSAVRRGFDPRMKNTS